MRILWLNDDLICKRDVELGNIYYVKTQVFQRPLVCRDNAIEKMYV